MCFDFLHEFEILFWFYEYYQFYTPQNVMNKETNNSNNFWIFMKIKDLFV